MLSGDQLDSLLRVEVFHWLRRMVDVHGDVLTWQQLLCGFDRDGRRIPLVGPKGIFKPAVFPELPLSITTSPDGPYDDTFSDDGLLTYHYQGTDPQHPDNVGLRTAMQRGTPLVYFHGIMKAKYLAVWPVYVVGDRPSSLTFSVAVEDANLVARDIGSIAQSVIAGDAETGLRRKYITAQTKVRLHQHSFRESVLTAYRDQCALCRLKHRELLDAAHIIPDSDPDGEPVVSNGLSLCKLHHAAFDKNFIGIRPDYVVVVRDELLRESDGPMLRHGLQGMHGARLVLPRRVELRPEPEALEERFEEFRRVG